MLDDDLGADDALARAVDALRAHDALAQTAAEARRWSDSAVAALAPLPRGRSSRPAKFAAAVVDRAS